MSAERKVYRRCNCPRTHKTFLGFAMCVWPQAQWVLGEGPYATVRGCHGLTVLLHATEQAAEDALHTIHPGSVNGRCQMRHELAVLVLSEDGVRGFIPVEHEARACPSRPVQWYVLVKAMETYRRRTGFGLAQTWSLVHGGDFDGALASFRDTVDDALLPPNEQRRVLDFLRLADGGS